MEETRKAVQEEDTRSLKKATIFAFLALLAPPTLFLGQGYSTGLYDGTFLEKIFFHPIFLIFLVVYTGLYTLLFFQTLKRVKAYDGSEQSRKESNKAAKLNTMITLAFTSLFGIFSWVVFEYLAISQNVVINSTALLLMCVGDCFLLAYFLELFICFFMKNGVAPYFHSCQNIWHFPCCQKAS